MREAKCTGADHGISCSPSYEISVKSIGNGESEICEKEGFLKYVY